MTVEQLIKELQTYPKDMFVVTYGSNYIDEGIKLRLIEEYFNGDPANPKCEVIYNNVLELM